MKNYIILIVLISLFACTATKKTSLVKPSSEYKIVNTPIITGSDTISTNELRFYKIQSALDGMKLMYLNYGKWNTKIDGKHQQNINRIIWQNIKLIAGDDKTFTVIANGSETTTDYFACLMVFDSEEKDCFSDEHPDKEKLIALFTSKINKMDENSSVYKLFR